VEDAAEQRPFFSRSGSIYFMRERARGLYSLYRVTPDGSGRQKVSEDVHFLVNITPDEKWAVSWSNGPVTSLIPLDGGPPVRLCACGLGPIYPDSPSVAWSDNGQTVFVARTGGALSISWHGADTSRALAGSARSEWEKLPGARYVAEMSLAPGPTSATYAFVRHSAQSNLYRIQLP
jgi:hypothetical protein